jgi:hypothetical protein
VREPSHVRCSLCWGWRFLARASRGACTWANKQRAESPRASGRPGAGLAGSPPHIGGWRSTGFAAKWGHAAFLTPVFHAQVASLRVGVVGSGLHGCVQQVGQHGPTTAGGGFAASVAVRLPPTLYGVKRRARSRRFTRFNFTTCSERSFVAFLSRLVHLSGGASPHSMSCTPKPRPGSCVSSLG